MNNRSQNLQANLKKSIHSFRATARATLPSAALVIALGVMTCSCSEGKKTVENKTDATSDKPGDRSSSSTEQQEQETRSSFSILEQLHKDTILRRVRLPRYDENFTPLSLLTAVQMEVIDGQTIEAQDVSMELYRPDGSVKARTKMRKAIYQEDTATLEAREAIYIQGSGFEASGSGLIYDTNTGRGFVLGPASTLFQIEQPEPSGDPAPKKATQAN